MPLSYAMEAAATMRPGRHHIAMRHYVAALDKLLACSGKIYWPGHGEPVKEPQRFPHARVPFRRAR
ncbi:MAG: hypothetical protein ACRD36_05870, partial [Candidatus Acidiferrum sp.]